MLSSRVEVTDIPMCLTWDVSDWAHHLWWGMKGWEQEGRMEKGVWYKSKI